LELRLYGDPVLRKKAQPVDHFDSSLRQLVSDMIESLHDEDGVGLAAPQVGVSLRVAVIDPTAGEAEPYVLINPQIISSSDEIVANDEGCLSLPGVTLSIKRPSKVTVKACDVEGKEYIIENAEGLLCRALQHEIDHLDGIMIVDHVSMLQRQMINGKLKKMVKSGREKSQTD
jgi:peptide deformylase